MIERLIFGCGYLTGGAVQTTSHRLVSQCWPSALRHGADLWTRHGGGRARTGLAAGWPRGSTQGMPPSHTRPPRSMAAHCDAASRGVNIKRSGISVFDLKVIVVYS
jgi:hypothetical protein